MSILFAEIVELFQWMTQEESRDPGAETLARLEEEIGDVMIYLARLADKFGLNPLDLAKRKIAINARKYPADLVRGKAKKYTEY